MAVEQFGNSLGICDGSRPDVLDGFLERLFVLLGERRLEIFKGQLGSHMASALFAVLNVAPRPDHLGVLLIEEDGEPLGLLVEFDPEQEMPMGSDPMALEFDTLDDPAKLHVFCVEEPRCMAGFKNRRKHASSSVRQPKTTVRFTCPFRDIEVDLVG
ncbi:MAG TPA: hypothetical protein VMF35_09530 [Acidimicrobiales bacterium]|nr:hypothetical protein [Acidimicrobiales bacterium]